jgi:hypothetical protein
MFEKHSTNKKQCDVACRRGYNGNVHMISRILANVCEPIGIGMGP